MLYLAHLMHSHEGDKSGAWVACGLLGIGGLSDEGGGGRTFAFGGADAEPCVAGPEKSSDGTGPGGP